MTTIRRATVDDIPALARTLTAAFASYSWTRWSVPADDHLQRLGALFTLDLTMIGIPHNETWMSDDANAVAVWIPPRHVQTRVIDREGHATLSAPLLGNRLAAAEEADEIIAAHRPQEPAWYLATTGVYPDHQRRGLGSAVLQPVLERCDAEGMPCLAETSTPENVAFYARLGFTILADVTLPGDAPGVHILRRPPRG